MFRRLSVLASVAAGALLLLPGNVAYAAPGAAGPQGIVNFGNALLEFLTGSLGPIVLGLGIVVGALSWAMGSPRGMSIIFGSIGAGVILMNVRGILDFIGSFS